MNPTISSVLSPQRVLIDLQVGSKKQLLEHAAKLIEQHHGILTNLICDVLFAREKLGSTALGLGVAIPHGRLKGLDQALGVLVRLATPIDFSAPDGQPVSLVFVLLVPEKANEEHLQLLSELAEKFSNRTVRENCLHAADAAALFDALARDAAA